MGTYKYMFSVFRKIEVTNGHSLSNRLWLNLLSEHLKIHAGFLQPVSESL